MVCLPQGKGAAGMRRAEDSPLQSAILDWLQYSRRLVSCKASIVRDIEAELAPKINPKIHDLNFVTLA
jgi:hypothetical protein